MKGTVIWFDPGKGYGFIRTSDNNKDIFVHITAVQRAGMKILLEGQVVSFDVLKQETGRLTAVNLSQTT